MAKLMEARIVRGKPSKTLQGQQLWQLQTRPRPQSEWTQLYGKGHTSTSETELRESARAHGWKLVSEEE